MILSSVSNHHYRYLITLKSSGIHYAFLSTTDSVRACLLVRSLMQCVASCLSYTAAYGTRTHIYVSARLFVLYCCVLVHIASVVTHYTRTTRMVKNQPQ